MLAPVTNLKNNLSSGVCIFPSMDTQAPIYALLSWGASISAIKHGYNFPGVALS